MNFNKLNTPCLLLLSGTFLIIAVLTTIGGYKPFGLIFFVFTGIFQGIYYGLNNHRIFHFPYKDEYYQGFKPESKKVNGVPPLTESARMNSVWVHLLCSLSGAVALYFLLFRLWCVFELNTHLPDYLRFSDLVLFLIGILGFTGLLPMTLWFFARSGDVLANLIKK